jgi:hypothetical protein
VLLMILTFLSRWCTKDSDSSTSINIDGPIG